MLALEEKRHIMDGKGDLSGEALALAEKNALVIGACHNIIPKLVAEYVLYLFIQTCIGCALVLFHFAQICLH